MKKFEINKTYSCRSVCDNDCVWQFKVISRTDKTVKIVDTQNKKEMNRKIINNSNGEYVKPFGSYSMCPILRA